MANNRLGDIRRSVAVMTFGPGSVVDFRADGAPVSAVPAGLEEWDANSSALGRAQQISEPRLQRKLSVGGFRLPPVVDDDRGRDTLVAVRFPEWLQCPQCDRIALAGRWKEEPGRAYRYCAHCTRKMPGQRKVFAVPVRFVMACAKGHLDEFPWHFWVRHKDDCKKGPRADLYLKSERPGLSGLILSCRECKARRSMDGVFSAKTWRVQCRGRRPWLAANDEQCESEPRALQRGASNIYFPVVESALSIPPWSDLLQEALGLHWNTIVDTKPKDRSALIQIFTRNVLEPILRELDLSPEDFERHIQDRLTQYNDESILNIRQEEYRQFMWGTDTTVGDERDFEVRNVSVPDCLRPFLSRVVRAVRLREVRALKGFTRINPPGDEDSSEIASISVGRPNWLPAIEVRGEGIFLAFNQETLRGWEVRDRVVERAQSVHMAWRKEWKQRYGEDEPALRITPRYLLAHTFAHALMRQLTLLCGYSTAALRERLYVSDGNDGMAGLLIYTATPDSDGTLGGLQRQGEAHLIEPAVVAATRAMEWCSSDPLCIETALAGSDRMSFAACHACVLAPETACEEYNRFLDRAVLVGLPGAPDVGFFSPLMQSRA